MRWMMDPRFFSSPCKLDDLLKFSRRDIIAVENFGSYGYKSFYFRPVVSYWSTASPSINAYGRPHIKPIASFSFAVYSATYVIYHHDQSCLG
jgi:hypothetical protein